MSPDVRIGQLSPMIRMRLSMMTWGRFVSAQLGSGSWNSSPDRPHLRIPGGTLALNPTHISQISQILSLLMPPFPVLPWFLCAKYGENGSLRNAALSAFEEGAPFMGTALAEYRQCIGPRLSAFSPTCFNVSCGQA